MNAPSIEWNFEYLPFIVTEADGSERDLPNYRIFPADEDTLEHYIAETNEHLPGDVQEAHARLISSAPKLREALQYFYNVMHDPEDSRRKGYIKQAMEQARIALAKVNGRTR